MTSKAVASISSVNIMATTFALLTFIMVTSAQSAGAAAQANEEAILKSSQAARDAVIENGPRPAANETPKVEIGPQKIEFVRFGRQFGVDHSAKTRFLGDSAETLFPPPKRSTSDWQFAFSPYLYMTGVTGTIGARGRISDIDLDFADVIENLNLGIMGAVEARKGRFVVVNDMMWIKLGEERDTPGGLFSSVKLGVNLFVWDPEMGYRLYEGKGGSFDLLGGVRIMSVENNVNFRAGILPESDVSERKTWGTPVIGAHGTLNLSPKFFLATKFDIGGGLGADFTGQFYGGAGYRLTPKIALAGGYRFVKTKYDSEGGFLFDTTMNGVMLGAKFTF